MRTLSLDFREALYGQESGEVPIFLVTITHPVLALPIRLSSDATTRLSEDPLIYATISRANTFLYAGLSIVLPDEQDSTPPRAQLIIANVDRSLIPTARSIVSPPPSAMIEIVKSSDLDTVEVSWPAFDMTNLQGDIMQLTFDLTIDPLTTEPYPAGVYGPSIFPGLYR